MKAKAKLKTSACLRLRPERRPTEIVEPDLENPRNGKASPWIAPMRIVAERSILPPASLPLDAES